MCVQVYMIIHTDHSVATSLPLITTAPEFQASPQSRQLLGEGGKDRGREGQERQRSTRRDCSRGCCKYIYTYVCICIHTALCILLYTDKYPQTNTYHTHTCIHHKSTACIDSQKETECSFILNSSESRMSICTASTRKGKHLVCGLQTVPCPGVENVGTRPVFGHFVIE